MRVIFVAYTPSIRRRSPAYIITILDPIRFAYIERDFQYNIPSPWPGRYSRRKGTATHRVRVCRLCWPLGQITNISPISNTARSHYFCIKRSTRLIKKLCEFHIKNVTNFNPKECYEQSEISYINKMENIKGCNIKCDTPSAESWVRAKGDERSTYASEWCARSFVCVSNKSKASTGTFF